MRKTSIARALPAVALLTVSTACSTNASEAPADGSTTTPDARSDGSSTVACAAAGGQCLVGGVCGAMIAMDRSCGPGALCCADVICEPDADVQNILASNYDRSCTTDSDCIAVGTGNACAVCEIGCPNTAIGKSGLVKYRADVAKSPADGADCGCGAQLPGEACCLGGECQFGPLCLAVDAAPHTGSGSNDAGTVDAVSE